MVVWGRIYYSNIFTINLPISTTIIQLLATCDIVVGYIDKWIVNLEIQVYVNIELIQFICIRWILLISTGCTLYLLEKLARIIASLPLPSGSLSLTVGLKPEGSLLMSPKPNFWELYLIRPIRLK